MAEIKRTRRAYMAAPNVAVAQTYEPRIPSFTIEFVLDKVAQKYETELRDLVDGEFDTSDIRRFLKELVDGKINVFDIPTLHVSESHLNSELEQRGVVVAHAIIILLREQTESEQLDIGNWMALIERGLIPLASIVTGVDSPVAKTIAPMAELEDRELFESLWTLQDGDEVERALAVSDLFTQYLEEKEIRLTEQQEALRESGVAPIAISRSRKSEAPTGINESVSESPQSSPRTNRGNRKPKTEIPTKEDLFYELATLGAAASLVSNDAIVYAEGIARTVIGLPQAASYLLEMLHRKADGSPVALRPLDLWTSAGHSIAEHDGKINPGSYALILMARGYDVAVEGFLAERTAVHLLKNIDANSAKTTSTAVKYLKSIVDGLVDFHFTSVEGLFDVSHLTHTELPTTNDWKHLVERPAMYSDAGRLQGFEIGPEKRLHASDKLHLPVHAVMQVLAGNFANFPWLQPERQLDAAVVASYGLPHSELALKWGPQLRASFGLAGKDSWKAAEPVELYLDDQLIVGMRDYMAPVAEHYVDILREVRAIRAGQSSGAGQPLLELTRDAIVRALPSAPGYS